MILNHIEHTPEGAETAPPLMIAHGLFGSARNFNTLGRKLADGRRVILLDMPNHGESGWTDNVSYPAMASDLAETIRALTDGHAVLLGHSMGGKAAMALALTEPEVVAGLIVADIAPVRYDHTHKPILEAMQATDLSAVTRRSEVDGLLADAIPDAGLRSFIVQNVAIEDGKARWRLNVDALLAGMDDLIGWPDELSRETYAGAVLALYGERSEYADAPARDALAALFPHAAFQAIPGAGHWLHAEKPAEFLAAVEGWLARTG